MIPGISKLPTDVTDIAKKRYVANTEKSNSKCPGIEMASMMPSLIVKKHQKSVTGIEDQVLAMYAKGMSSRDIEDHLRDIYGIDASVSLISWITDKIMPEVGMAV